MKKDLENMTLTELWELFPIVLTEYNPEWKEWAKEEITQLFHILAGFNPVINHVGSTAIPGIMAKPIVDILVELSTDFDWEEVKRLMESNGYICMSKSRLRMSFNKGYTPEGYADRVFHIHFHQPGDNDEIEFRDYMTANPHVAKEYERLKLSLLPKYKHDRDGYTDAKSNFISSIINKLK